MATESAPAHVFALELDKTGARVTLSMEESHYLLRVCRVRDGDRVIATDGRGTRATVRIVAARSPVSIEIEVTDFRARSREAWLLCGSPEGERGDWMVEKLGELGVGVLQPVECERGGWSRAGARMERWRRLARAALRQSQGRYEMDVRPPLELAAALELLPPEAMCWLADPDGRPASELRPSLAGLGAGAVGPARGFSPVEKSRLAAGGFQTIGLAAARLRTETAALAWAAWWGFLDGRQ